MGIYAIEETCSQKMIETSGRREGVIVYEEYRMWNLLFEKGVDWDNLYQSLQLPNKQFE